MLDGSPLFLMVCENICAMVCLSRGDIAFHTTQVGREVDEGGAVTEEGARECGEGKGGASRKRRMINASGGWPMPGGPSGATPREGQQAATHICPLRQDGPASLCAKQLRRKQQQSLFIRLIVERSVADLLHRSQPVTSVS